MSVEPSERHILSNVSFTIGTSFGVMLFGIATSIVSARALGPAGRGQYFAVTTLSGLFAQALTLGLTSSNVLLGAKDRSRLRPLLNNSAYVAAFFGLAGAACVAVWGGPLASRMHLPIEFLLAVCVIGATTLFWFLGTSLLVAEERFRTMNLWNLAKALMSVAGVAICAIYAAGPGGFVLAAALVGGAAGVGLFRFMIAGKEGPRGFSWTLARLGFGFSSRAYLALFFGYYLQRAGATILTLRGQSSVLGQYSIASQGFDALVIIPGAVGTVLFPLLVRMTEESWSQVKRAAQYTVLLMLLVCGVTAIAASWVVPFVFGKQYSAAVPVLWALLPGVICYSLVSVLSQYLVRRDFPWPLVIIWAIGFVVAFGAAGILTGRYGAIGAAIGQSLGAMLVCGGVLAIIGSRSYRQVGRVEV